MTAAQHKAADRRSCCLRENGPQRALLPSFFFHSRLLAGAMSLLLLMGMNRVRFQQSLCPPLSDAFAQLGKPDLLEPRLLTIYVILRRFIMR